MDELIIKISQLYLKYGIKSVTMDDVSRHLCISKKTLYQYFKDKDDLVKKVVTFYLANQECEEQSLHNEKYNAIDILLVISKYLANKIKEMNPSVNYDLQKYHPESWKILAEYRHNHVYEQIKQNMIDGIKQGLYRKDLKIDLIATFYLFRTEKAMDDNFFQIKDYSFEEIFNNMFIYHIRAIANEKGLKYLEEKIKNENLN